MNVINIEVSWSTYRDCDKEVYIYTDDKDLALLTDVHDSTVYEIKDMLEELGYKVNIYESN